MGLAKKIKKALAGAAFAATVLTSQTNSNADETTLNQARTQQIQENARNSMRDEENALLPASEGIRFNMGGVDDYIFNYLFRVPGRVRWAQIYPNSRFGHHRENSRDLNWQRHDSLHYSFFTTNDNMLQQVVPLAEETYTDFSNRMNVRTFNEKIRVHLFRDRIEFEQMGMFPGLVPEGLGGITEIMEEMHNKIVFLNDGEQEFMHHVGRHELSHRFRMEQFRRFGGGNLTTELPLWFIEGIAEHDSLHMDASIDASIRDAYFNGFLELGVSPMLQGTRFMYDAGTVYTNYIADNYGERALNEIVRNAGRGFGFESNLRRVTNLTMEELSRKVNESLANKFGNRFNRNGLEDRSSSLGNSVVMAANNNYFVMGVSRSLQDTLVIARKVGNELVAQEFDADGIPGSDSLHRFRHGADIFGNQIAYVIRDGVQDVIRIKHFNYEDEDFEISDEHQLRFNNIDFIKNPRLLNHTKIAFVGVQEGFMDLYMYDIVTEDLTRLTNNEHGIRGLDYNAARNSLIFSLESEERTANPSKCDFNYDLHELDLETLSQTSLTSTDFDETNPSVSPDGKRIVFNTDEHGSRDLALYDYSFSRTLNLPRARIAASTPSWQSNDKIAFNSLEEMGPAAFSYTVPNSVSMLRSELNNSRNRPERSSSRIGNIEFSQGRISVTDSGRSFNINHAVSTENVLYLSGRTTRGDRNIFAVEEFGARALNENNKSLEEILIHNHSAGEFNRRFGEENTLLSRLLSSDQKFIALAVNNRMSFQYEEYRSDFPVSLYLYNLETDRLNRLPEIQLDRVDNFKSMHPLVNGRILMHVTEDHLIASTDNEYLLYDLNTNRLVNLNAELVTVDRNKRFVMGLKELNEIDKVFVYDSETGQTRFLDIDVDDYSLLNITQTSGGNFLIREEGAHGDCKHYTVFNPENNRFTRWNFDRALGNHHIISDLVQLPNGEIATVQNKLYAVSTGLFFGEELVTNTRSSELYITENNRFKRRLNGYRKVNIVAQDGSNLLVDAEKSNNTSDLVAVSDDNIVATELRDSETDSSNSHIVYSDNRNVKVFDRGRRQTTTYWNSLGFDVSGTKLAYTVNQNGSFNVFERDLERGVTRRVAVSSINEFLPRYRNNQLTFSRENRRRPPRTSIPNGNYPTSYVGLEESDINTAPFDYMSLTGMGVITNNGKFLILDFASTDMLEERIFNLNYMGNFDDGFNFGSVSYLDRSRNFGLSSYIQELGANLNTGISGSLLFPQSRFSQFDLSLGYEYQEMDAIDFSGNNHVLKLGAGFGHDSSLYGIHGPRDGDRLALITELGLSLNHQTLSNADVYLAARKYVHFCDFAYLALAADAGTSQGLVPTLMLNGGNMSLRGVPFGHLLGNNVAMARSELRLNIIQAAGVQFAEPITPFSIFSITPIPEIGWYNDVGATWYYNAMASDEANKEIPFELYYSGGPTFNLTTFLGLVARFNFPVYGNAKEWNFWLGYVGSNW